LTSRFEHRGTGFDIASRFTAAKKSRAAKMPVVAYGL
jgi:hypothetical protein